MKHNILSASIMSGHELETVIYCYILSDKEEVQIFRITDKNCHDVITKTNNSEEALSVLDNYIKVEDLNETLSLEEAVISYPTLSKSLEPIVIKRRRDEKINDLL